MLLKNKLSFSVLPMKAVKPIKPEAIPSVINRDVNIVGNIVCDGVVDCDGTVEGNVRCHTLTLRPHGQVKGEITADHVLVYGKVNGTIRAKQVQLFSSCRVEGVVLHESLIIEDGAFIDGKCKRSDKPVEAETAKDDDAKPEAQNSELVKNIRLIRT